MNNEDADMVSVTITVNTAMTETASDILGKHHQKKKTWATAEIADLCWTEKETFKLEQRCMNKAKENWIGVECSEI